MATASGGVIDRRERFKNKKKARSFQSATPLISIDYDEIEPSELENIESNSPSTVRIIHMSRSRSTADIHYLLHNAVFSEDIPTLERVLDQDDSDKTLNINNMSTDGMTALHQACIVGNLTIVIMLLDAGASFLIKTKDGRSPLQLAVSSGNYEVAEYLLSKGVQQDDIKNGIPTQSMTGLSSTSY